MFEPNHLSHGASFSRVQVSFFALQLWALRFSAMSESEKRAMQLELGLESKCQVASQMIGCLGRCRCDHQEGLLLQSKQVE